MGTRRVGHAPVGWARRGILEQLATPHGRVIFAGSDVAVEHPGWIAGAIASGHAQARTALALLGARSAAAGVRSAHAT